MEIIAALKTFGIAPVLCDPMADPEEVKRGYGYKLTAFEDVKDADCLVLAVAHEKYRKMLLGQFDMLFKRELEPSEKVIIDIKSVLDKKEVEAYGYSYWRL